MRGTQFFPPLSANFTISRDYAPSRAMRPSPRTTTTPSACAGRDQRTCGGRVESAISIPPLGASDETRERKSTRRMAILNTRGRLRGRATARDP